MYKTIISTLAIVLAFGATAASAQSAYSYSGSCTTISQNLSRGSRGADVTALQRFIVAQNYPGGGSWMITGTFGAATEQGVRNFQTSQGLASTGIVDSATATAISRVSCGTGYSTGYTGSTGYQDQYSYQPSWYQNGYSYPSYLYTSGTLALTSLSQNTGFAGNSITIYGTGFDRTNNTVWLGGTPVYNIPSYTGNSITFAVPYLTVGGNNMNVQLSVQNSRGSSNQLAFTFNPVNTEPIVCSSYPFSSCGCGYTSCGPDAPISITYLSPQQGGVGSVVTIYGTGFSTSGNTVHFGSGVLTNLGSPDGRSISFTVPQQITGYGSQVLVVGTYNISVTNQRGATSNAVSYYVNSTNASNAPSITSVSGPNSLNVNQSGTWTITVNASNNSYTTLSVNWGDTNVYGGTNTKIGRAHV